MFGYWEPDSPGSILGKTHLQCGTRCSVEEPCQCFSLGEIREIPLPIHKHCYSYRLLRLDDNNNGLHVSRAFHDTQSALRSSLFTHIIMVEVHYVSSHGCSGEDRWKHGNQSMPTASTTTLDHHQHSDTFIQARR